MTENSIHEEKAIRKVHYLDVGDWWKRLLTVCVLRREGEQTGDPQGDPGGHGLGLDPERDPGHDDDQTGGDVGVEQVVAESTLEHEDDLEAGELSWKTGKKTFWETCLGGRVVEHHEESMETCVIRSHKSPLVYSIWTELLSAKFIHGSGLIPLV